MYYHLRKSYVFPLLIIALMCFVIVTCRSCDKEASKDIHDSARETLRQGIEKLKSILNKYPEDAQLRLGAAELLRIGGGLEYVPKNLTPTKMYEMAVKLDSGNHPARARLMRGIVPSHVDDLSDYYKQLRKADDGGTPKKVAEKIRKSAASSRPGLVERTNYLLEELRKSASVDPDNALYDYLSASMYFVEGQKQEAINKIEKGLNKKYMSLYTKERIEARQRLLDEMDFPSPEREGFLTTRTSFTMPWHLCRDLLEIGEEHQKNGKFTEAENFYNMVVRIAEQTKEDQFFISQEIRRWHLMKYGLQHLKGLYEDMKEEQKRNEVMSSLEKVESRMQYLYNLMKKAPSYDNIPQIKSYANDVVKKGELKALELLPSK